MRMLTLVLAAGGVLSQPVLAQGNNASIPGGRALGVTVDRFNLESGSLGAATFHLSTIRPKNLSSEFAISLFPAALGAGALITNADLGAALSVPLPGAILLVKGGASGLFAFGRGGAGALPGAHYGVSLLVKFAARSGFRFDVIRHFYWVPNELSVPVLTIGVGVTSLPGSN